MDLETALVNLVDLDEDLVDLTRVHYLDLRVPYCSSGKHTRIKIKPIKIVKTIYIYISSGYGSCFRFYH